MTSEKLFKGYLKTLKRDEGLSLDLYLDTRGHPTIGFGTNIKHIDMEEAEWLLQHRAKQAMIELQRKKPFVKELPNEVQVVLYNMAYNLGVQGLLGFRKMWKAIENRDWEGMIREMYDSDWYRRDVGSRVDRLADEIRKLL